MYCFMFIYYIRLLDFHLVSFWASWCALDCKELSFELQDCAVMYPFVTLPLISFIKLNGVLHFIFILVPIFVIFVQFCPNLC